MQRMFQVELIAEGFGFTEGVQWVPIEEVSRVHLSSCSREEDI